MTIEEIGYLGLGLLAGLIIGFVWGALAPPLTIEVGPEPQVDPQADVHPQAVGRFEVARNGCPHGTDCYMPEACFRRGQCGGKPVTFTWPPEVVACPNAREGGKCFRQGRCIAGPCPT